MGRGDERAEDSGDIRPASSRKSVCVQSLTRKHHTLAGPFVLAAPPWWWGKSARISSPSLRGLGGSELGSFSFGDGRHG